MKKITKIVACLLCCIMVSSLLIAIIDKISVYASIADYGIAYNKQTYANIESLSRRETLSDSNAQITVFTHGCGGDKSHWSSDLNFNFEK